MICEGFDFVDGVYDLESDSDGSFCWGMSKVVLRSGTKASFLKMKLRSVNQVDIKISTTSGKSDSASLGRDWQTLALDLKIVPDDIITIEVLNAQRLEEDSRDLAICFRRVWGAKKKQNSIEQAILDTSASEQSTHSSALEENAILREIRLLSKKIDLISSRITNPIAIDSETLQIVNGDGLVFRLPTKDFLFTPPMVYGSVEAELKNWMISNLKNEDVFVDIGANFGLYTVLAGRLISRPNSIYAFEPNPFILKFLRQNLLLNAPLWEYVNVIDKACGSCSGKAEFSARKFFPGNSTLLEVESQLLDQFDDELINFEVDVIRLDEFTFPGKERIVCKIDVEGFELEVIQGMKNLLASERDIVLVFEWSNSTNTRSGKQIIQLFKELGYTLSVVVLNGADDRPFESDIIIDDLMDIGHTFNPMIVARRS